ncbi:MAG: hypothetical protein N4A49_07785 [Marinifilaceae bacterium]|jgi:hypothetical protein|nr:hypothetical protein [Marinifilaceae bacterium]
MKKRLCYFFATMLFAVIITNNLTAQKKLGLSFNTEISKNVASSFVPVYIEEFVIDSGEMMMAALMFESIIRSANLTTAIDSVVVALENSDLCHVVESFEINGEFYDSQSCPNTLKLTATKPYMDIMFEPAAMCEDILDIYFPFVIYSDGIAYYGNKYKIHVEREDSGHTPGDF